jgi:hypothetical protein
LLGKWLKLAEYVPEDEVRQSLKVVSRQYTKYIKIKTTLVSSNGLPNPKRSRR